MVVMDEIKQEKLRKIAGEILDGGRQAVESFDCAGYTEEELKYIEAEMDRLTTRDLDIFMQNLETGE